MDPTEKTPVRLALAKLRQKFSKSSDRVLGKALRRAFPGIKRNRPGSRKARGEMCYYGICEKKTKLPILSPHGTIGDTLRIPKAKRTAKRNNCYVDAKVPPHLHINQKLLQLTTYEAGRGTFGQCTVARYRGVDVIVKQLSNPKQLEAERLKKEVLHEACMMLQLSQHPYLPFLIGVEIASAPYLIVTQLHTVNDRPLSIFKALRNSATYSPHQFDWEDIAEKCCRAVLAVHKCGILHNDIKGKFASTIF